MGVGAGRASREGKGILGRGSGDQGASPPPKFHNPSSLRSKRFSQRGLQRSSRPPSEAVPERDPVSSSPRKLAAPRWKTHFGGFWEGRRALLLSWWLLVGDPSILSPGWGGILFWGRGAPLCANRKGWVRRGSRRDAPSPACWSWAAEASPGRRGAPGPGAGTWPGGPPAGSRKTRGPPPPAPAVGQRRGRSLSAWLGSRKGPSDPCPASRLRVHPALLACRWSLARPRPPPLSPPPKNSRLCLGTVCATPQTLWAVTIKQGSDGLQVDLGPHPPPQRLSGCKVWGGASTRLGGGNSSACQSQVGTGPGGGEAFLSAQFRSCRSPCLPPPTPEVEGLYLW